MESDRRNGERKKDVQELGWQQECWIRRISAASQREETHLLLLKENLKAFQPFPFGNLIKESRQKTGCKIPLNTKYYAWERMDRCLVWDSGRRKQGRTGTAARACTVQMTIAGDKRRYLEYKGSKWVKWQRIMPLWRSQKAAKAEKWPEMPHFWSIYHFPVAWAFTPHMYTTSPISFFPLHARLKE